jgi:hypothetical protein
MNGDFLDEDGYPTDEALQRITDWPYQDVAAMLQFVRGLWSYPNFWTQEGDKLSISTGGWSGNESLIDAMSKNDMFWVMCWYSFSG